MGQVLHRSATTAETVRRAIQHRQASLRELARRHGIHPNTVAKWRKRDSKADRRTGPTEARSTVLSLEQEAVLVAFRRHTLLPLDDCLCALQATMPQLTRSSWHRCLERHIFTENGIPFADLPRNRQVPTARSRAHPFDRVCAENCRVLRMVWTRMSARAERGWVLDGAGIAFRPAM